VNNRILELSGGRLELAKNVMNFLLRTDHDEAKTKRFAFVLEEN